MNNFLSTINVLANDLHTDDVTTIDKIIIDFFNKLFQGNGWGNFLLTIFSFLLCLILVGIIGYQREAQGHNAGFRTHLLVGMGSCLIMVISMYSIGYSADKYETMRLAASVPTGIGFLGAGVIIKNRATIKGLTTASTLWVSMAIGLACGSGNFTIAILGSLVIYLILFFFYKFEIHAGKKASKLVIYLEKDSKISFKEIMKAIKMEDGRKILANYGLDPKLGKYNRSFCEDCNCSIETPPPATVCDKCGGTNITMGVYDRIEIIKDQESTSPSFRPKYNYQIPLGFMPGVGGKTIEKLLSNFGTEMTILHKIAKDDIEGIIGAKQAEIIDNARKGQMHIHAGGGGVYGKVQIG